MDENLVKTLERIAASLEKVAENQAQRSLTTPAPMPQSSSNCFVFDATENSLLPIERLACPDLSLLKGIDRARETLFANTKRFAEGFNANNALLWGARGMGKSTLVKSIFKDLVNSGNSDLKLVEIHREDIIRLPSLLNMIKSAEGYYIVFCDDLSFNRPDRDFKALKSVLEGGLEGRPENVIFYATSNRRHLLPRAMMDQESATGINPNEAMDEVIALSDRFGLWLGFHPCDQAEYLSMIDGYFGAFNIQADQSEWEAEALEWSKTRGSRSGRTAWQFFNDYAGKKSLKISF
ncbi:ATP-binding protein [Kordiimonas sp. SCSIO 12610]|nr:ATP-binding protein [Kordiimonas sp. SCSIO 12610]